MVKNLLARLSRPVLMLVGALMMALLPTVVASQDASASHSWGGYHWARTANPFQLEIEKDVTGDWGTYLTEAQVDWNVSSVLDTKSTDYRSPNRKCSAIDGKVAVCNNSYGGNGWLGIAQIWVSGSHIAQGIVKLNDFYFSSAPYNTPEWKQMVMCQEIGHTFGLDHQDEVFDNTNLGTCMDYTNDPGSNQHPNDHDYAQLEEIYAHLDSVNSWTVGAPGGGGKGGKNGRGGLGFDAGDEDLGRPARHTAGETLFVKDLGGGNKKLTWVRWADPSNRKLR